MTIKATKNSHQVCGKRFASHKSVVVAVAAVMVMDAFYDRQN